MNELALFTGGGGGILGSLLLGWHTKCAVEIVAYRRERLLQRQREGHIEAFPVWDDVTTFDGRPWNGFIDVVSGGFPCQDISAAGKGAGIRGERSGLWSEFARIIGEVQPRFVWLENSPMLVVRGIDVVCGDLAALGYDARWGVVSAADAIWAQCLACGHFPALDHLRERIWICATRTDADGMRNGGETARPNFRPMARGDEANGSAGADTKGESIGTGLCEDEQGRIGRGRSSNGSGEGADAALRRLAMRWWAPGLERHAVRDDMPAKGCEVGNAEGVGMQGVGTGRQQEPRAHFGQGLPVCPDNADADGIRILEGRRVKRPKRKRVGTSGKPDADTDMQHGKRRGKPRESIGDGGETRDQPRGSGDALPDADGGVCDGRTPDKGRRSIGRTAVGGAGWWVAEPGLGRVASRVANRVDRLSAIGDGQVPAVVALAWHLITETSE